MVASMITRNLRLTSASAAAVWPLIALRSSFLLLLETRQRHERQATDVCRDTKATASRRYRRQPTCACGCVCRCSGYLRKPNWWTVSTDGGKKSHYCAALMRRAIDVGDGQYSWEILLLGGWGGRQEDEDATGDGRDEQNGMATAASSDATSITTSRYCHSLALRLSRQSGSLGNILVIFLWN